MIKPVKKDKNKITLRDLQQHPSEYNRSVESPCYFYNTYVRKEGEKILSEDEYKEFAKRELERRNKHKPKSIEIVLVENPLTPNEAIKPIDLSLSPQIQAHIDIIKETEEYIINKLGIPEDKLGEVKPKGDAIS